MKHVCTPPNLRVMDLDVGLICYAISTTEGSEPGAGWIIARSYLEITSNLTIYTRYKNKQALTAYFKKHNIEAKIKSVEFSKQANWILNKFPVQIEYHLWNLKVYLALRLNLEHNLIHHATYAGDWNITAIHFLKSKSPTILGPVGGAQQIPHKLRNGLSNKNRLNNKLHEIFGTFMRGISANILKNKNVTILVANESSAGAFKKLNPLLLQNIGFNGLEIPEKSLDSKTFFGAGRLLYWKNWELPIRAMQYLSDYNLKIAGNGPDHKKLQALIEKLGLSGRVELLGKIDKNSVIDLISKSKALVFPSLRDSASWNLAEAMHLSIPVVSLDVPGSEVLLKKFNLPLVKSEVVNPEVFAQAMLTFDQSAPPECFCDCYFMRKMQEVVRKIHLTNGT